MGAEQVLKWRAKQASPIVGPQRREVPGLKGGIQQQKNENLCWAAAIASCLSVIQSTRLDQCDLVEDFIPNCTVALCNAGNCDGRQEIASVFAELMVAVEVPVTSIFLPRPVGELALLQRLVSLKGAAICELFKHARIFYGFLEDGDTLFLADPLAASSVSDDVSFSRTFVKECWTYFVVRR